MKKSNIIFLAAFSAVVILFGIYFLVQLAKNKNLNPLIIVPEGTLTISVSDGESALLSGVIANDHEDGDLTNQIVVEGLSAFAEDMSRTVTYAVCDKNGNVSKATRRIVYSDYTPPRFSIGGQIIVGSWSDTVVMKQITARDGAEGDISGRIMIGEHEPIDSYTGLYSAEIEVKTQSGMTEKANIAVLVAPTVSRYLPTITLSEYLVYVNVGEYFSAGSYLANVIYNSGNGTGNVSITGDVDTSKAGDFIVEYTAVSSDGYTGHAYLTVCVR
jgi:hypothetical protein